MDYLRRRSNYLLAKIRSQQRLRRIVATGLGWAANILYLSEIGLTVSHFVFLFNEFPTRVYWQSAVTSVQLLIALFLWFFQPRERSLSNYMGLASLKQLRRRVDEFHNRVSHNEELTPTLSRELENLFQESDLIELLDQVEGLLRHAKSTDVRVVIEGPDNPSRYELPPYVPSMPQAMGPPPL